MSFGNPFENPTPNIETEPHIPSLEEIKVKMESLIGQENFEVLRTLEDEKGVYLYEVATVDEAGDASQYTYKRKGDYLETQSAQTCIDVAYYVGTLETGYPCSAENISEYDETTESWTDIAKNIDKKTNELSQKVSQETELPNENIDAESIELAITHLENVLTEAEQIFGSTNLDDVIAREQTNIELARSIREEVKPLLNSITTQIQTLSKITPGESLRQWNSNGDLTEEQFNSLTLRRKKLRNAIGAVTKFDKTTLAALEFRHDIEPINLIESESDK